MNRDSIVQIKDWNSSLGTITLTGEVFSSFTIARSLTPENFARLFEDYLNLGAKGFQEGRQAGLKLCKSHRTLQRLAICFALGLVAGLAEQEHSDIRNGVAIQTAKKLVAMIDQDELPLGMYI